MLTWEKALLVLPFNQQRLSPHLLAVPPSHKVYRLGCRLGCREIAIARVSSQSLPD
jgi:hypothetical protein